MKRKNENFDYGFVRGILITRWCLLNIAMLLMALLLIDYITYFNEYKDSIWIDYIQNQGTHTLTLISFFMLAKCAKHLNTLSTLTLNCKVSLALVIAINLYYIIGVDQSVYDPLEEFLYNGYHPDLN